MHAVELPVRLCDIIPRIILSRIGISHNEESRADMPEVQWMDRLVCIAWTRVWEHMEEEEGVVDEQESESELAQLATWLSSVA